MEEKRSLVFQIQGSLEVANLLDSRESMEIVVAKAQFFNLDHFVEGKRIPKVVRSSSQRLMWSRFNGTLFLFLLLYKIRYISTHETTFISTLYTTNSFPQ
jgi:hypothetical protein